MSAPAKPFGLRIIGSRRHPQKLPNLDKVMGDNEWRSLLAISLHNPKSKIKNGMGE
ncbi:hypothetical protein [Nostoc sp.]|uniref:hypothetical protein n=1 Tax=Nostoc sp. TaxID=1180 RepID=UPI002FF4E9C8